MMHFNLQDTLVGGTVGGAYGFLMNKSQLHKTKLLRSQFELKDFTLLKTFGTSVATGCLAMAITNSLGHTPIRVKPTYMWANIVGGAMVGAGTYLGGSSLEAALVQLGACRRRALYVIGGALTGAITYGFLDDKIRGTFLGESGKLSALHTCLELPFAYVAIPFAGLVAGLVYAMEVISPTRKVIDETPIGTKPPETAFEKAVSCLEKESWSPYICGVGIGLLQIPTAMIQRSMLGVASPYFSTAASIVGLFGATNIFFGLYKTPDVYWTFPLNIGTIVGSTLSSKKKVTQETKKKAPLAPTKQIASFVGGFIVAFGSGLAVGSPSAHGLSGISQLSCGSMIAVVSMFGGGVITAQLLSDKRAEL